MKLYAFIPIFHCIYIWLFERQTGKFPTLVSHQESLESKVNETKATVKFQLKKVLCMGVAVGNLDMEEKQIFQNVQMSVNFLVSLLKKNWQNVSNTFLKSFLLIFPQYIDRCLTWEFFLEFCLQVRCLYLKSTMGPPNRVFWDFYLLRVSQVIIRQNTSKDFEEVWFSFLSWVLLFLGLIPKSWLGRNKIFLSYDNFVSIVAIMVSGFFLHLKIQVLRSSLYQISVKFISSVCYPTHFVNEIS